MVIGTWNHELSSGWKPKPGELVTLNSMIGETDLSSRTCTTQVTITSCGWMRINDVAVVVEIERHTYEVYIVGPNGIGWIPLSYLQAV